MWVPLLHLYTYFACWYWKLSQLPRATEVMDCRIKSTTTTLLDSIIAHYILNLILTSTDKCSYIPRQISFSSQQLETSTENHNWTQCRGQQAHRAPSSNRHSYITAPEFTAQGTLWKKDFKSQHNQEVSYETISLRHCRIHKTRTMATLVDKWMWKKENFMSPKKLQALMTARRSISFSQG